MIPAAAGAGGAALLGTEAGAVALATAAEVLSGPVGWAILAGTVVVGAAALYKAHSKSQEVLKPADTGQPCHDCGDGPDCFEPPDRSDPKSLEEFRRQLKGQQDGINKMSPQEVINGIDKYAAGGRQAYPAEAAMRRAYRDAHWDKVFDKALDKTGSKAAAQAMADAALQGQAALHNPDMYAGGGPKPTDLGSSRVNSSIGSQWAKKGASTQLDRSEQLKKAAERAKSQGKSKMDVKLEECEG